MPRKTTVNIEYEQDDIDRIDKHLRIKRRRGYNWNYDNARDARYNKEEVESAIDDYIGGTDNGW